MKIVNIEEIINRVVEDKAPVEVAVSHYKKKKDMWEAICEVDKIKEINLVLDTEFVFKIEKGVLYRAPLLLGDKKVTLVWKKTDKPEVVVEEVKQENKIEEFVIEFQEL